jgi:peptidoglycan hydrolase FlgJ
VSTVRPATAAAGPASAAEGAPPAAVRRAAEEFESVFISQILGELRIGFTPPGLDSGGEEDPFASMLRDEYAKIISRSGGIGLADGVLRELLRAQDVE